MLKNNQFIKIIVKYTKHILIFELFLIIFFLWLSYRKGLLFFLDSNSNNYLGLYGDSFGALNTLFSGLAFAGIIISIFLQSQELKETRKELAGQKNALKDQQASLKKQNDILNHQVFDGTFFQLLKIKNEITTNIRISNSGQRYVGWTSFRYIKEILYRALDEHNLPGNTKITGINYAGYSKDQYRKFYDKHFEFIGHYYNNLIQLLYLVENSSVIDKKKYMLIIRSLLHKDEIVLLFFFSILNYIDINIKNIVEKYSFLQNFPKDENFNHLLFELIDSSAFGNNKVIIHKFYKS